MKYSKGKLNAITRRKTCLVQPSVATCSLELKARQYDNNSFWLSTKGLLVAVDNQSCHGLQCTSCNRWLDGDKFSSSVYYKTLLIQKVAYIDKYCHVVIQS